MMVRVEADQRSPTPRQINQYVVVCRYARGCDDIQLKAEGGESVSFERAFGNHDSRIATPGYYRRGPMAEDAVRQWPQSGELIRSRARIADRYAGRAG